MKELYDAAVSREVEWDGCPCSKDLVHIIGPASGTIPIINDEIKSWIKCLPDPVHFGVHSTSDLYQASRPNDHTEEAPCRAS